MAAILKGATTEVILKSDIFADDGLFENDDVTTIGYDDDGESSSNRDDTWKAL